MDVFVPCYKSCCPDISSIGGSSITEPHSLFQNKLKDLSMSDLKTCLTDLLTLEETGISTSRFDLAHEKNLIDNAVVESDSKDVGTLSIACKSASEKCLIKCATFPPLSGPAYSGDVFVGEKGKLEEGLTSEVSEENGSVKILNLCYSRSASLPVPTKSSMKGNREKQHGTSSPNKLSVTWAPDVYDPIPTSVSHVPSDKNQRYRSKKYSKYKQKSGGGGGGKSLRGGSKSKCRRISGSSSNKHKQPLHILGEHRVGTLDHNVDPFCGTSFLKQSLTDLRFPVAEAT